MVISFFVYHILYSVHISESELVTLFTERSNIPYKGT